MRLLLLAAWLAAAAPARAAEVGVEAPRSVPALGAFFASPAADYRLIQGVGNSLRTLDYSDPAAQVRLAPVAQQLQAAAADLLRPPSAQATQAQLVAASKKLALLNDPTYRALLPAQTQRQVAAAFWAYSRAIYEDVTQDAWKPSRRPLAEKIAAVARSLEEAGAMPAAAAELPALRGDAAVAVTVVGADASKVHANGLIAAVQPHGFCHGGINAMIEKEGGSCYSRQVEAAKPLHDGRTLLAKGDQASRAAFKDVVFVVDGMKLPLDELVRRGLRAADDAGLSEVTLPAMRAGWNFGFLEKSYEEIVALTVKGVNRFLEEGRKAVSKISIVVHRDPRLLSVFRSVKAEDPERQDLRRAALSGEGYELAPSPRAIPERHRRSPIHRQMLGRWDVSKMLERRAPLRVGTLRDKAAFSASGASVLNMPIKLPGTGFRIPKELEGMREFLQKIIDYEAAANPDLDGFYAYLTVDHGSVKKGDTHRRPGVHIDGVQGARYPEKLPPEHTYSASDAVGTVFYAQSFDLRHIDPDKDYIHGELERQADEKSAVAAQDYGVYFWDSYSAHRAAVAEQDTPRTFVRVEFSKKVYDAAGDTKNPLFDYDWKRVSRPIPYELNWRAEPYSTLSQQPLADSRLVVVETAPGVMEASARAALRARGLSVFRAFERMTNGRVRLTARAARARDVAPAARALAKNASFSRVTVSDRLPKILELQKDYAAFPELGRPLEDGMVVEGSKPGGGVQTDFLIDHHDAALRDKILEPARRIGEEPIPVWEKLAKLQALVHAALPRDGWRYGRGHKRYAGFVHATRELPWVSLGDYVRLGVGVCRENALLTVVALRAAGFNARYGYFGVWKDDGLFDQDHALALVEVEGTTYVLDSYRVLARYFNGHRLADLLEPPADGKYPKAGPLAQGNDRDPGRWKLVPNEFPKVRPAAR